MYYESIPCYKLFITKALTTWELVREPSKRIPNGRQLTKSTISVDNGYKFRLPYFA
jgi:hypothetical protein